MAYTGKTIYRYYLQISGIPLVCYYVQAYFFPALVYVNNEQISIGVIYTTWFFCPKWPIRLESCLCQTWNDAILGIQ